MGMTAHVVFTSLDRELPATTSPTITSQVICGFIGFDGLLMSDDLSMGALSGRPDRPHPRGARRRLRRVGLHRNGNLAEMQAAAGAAPEPTGAAAWRADAALAARQAPKPLDVAAAWAEPARMMAGATCAPERWCQGRPRSCSSTPTHRAGARLRRARPDRRRRGVRGTARPAAHAGAPVQKVDLTKISILALANQYLVFIEQVRAMRIELAADYLVMAAWLAYLKSRMLLPDPPAPEGMSAGRHGECAGRRLRRLEAIRATAEQLFGRPQLGREVFGRGDPEPIHEIKHPKWSATLYDLLTAYASERQRSALPCWRGCASPSAPCWSLAEARAGARTHDRRGRRMGAARRIPAHLPGRALRCARTVMASSLAATLEMVREGQLELHQQGPFAPIYLRKRSEGADPPAEPEGPSEGGTA